MVTVLADAFPRRPAPHREPPNLNEIEEARATFALHIPSLHHRGCLGPGCTETWPCPDRRGSEATLDRAGLIDVDGTLRA